jgi:predicted transcriptional regulator
MSMRTTIELSDPLYRRIRALAAERGERGFSPIIEAAVGEYLERQGEGPATESAFAAARGAWGAADVDRFASEVRDAWSTWPTSRS